MTNLEQLSNDELIALYQKQGGEIDAGVTPPQSNAARTVFDQVGQGLSFGFLDEAQDALAAAGAKAYDATLGNGVYDGQSVGDVYDDARDLSQKRLRTQLQERPGLAIASNLGGALLTGGAAASKLPGIANSLRTGGTAARIAKGAGAGAASGGAYGFGAGEDGKRLESAKQGALYGAAGGAAIPAIGSAVSKAVKAVKPKSEIFSSDKIKQFAQQQYTSAASKGGLLKSRITNRFLDKIEDAAPQTKAGKMLAGENKVTKIRERMSALRDSDLSLDEVQEMDELLGDMIDSTVDVTGRISKEGKKLQNIQTDLRRIVDVARSSDVVGGKEGFEALKEGRRLWSQSAKMRDIERIIQRAEMMQNPAQGIKSGFRTLYNNPKRMRGFNKEERALIKRAAETGSVQDVLQTFGSRLMGIISLSSGAGPLATAAAQLGSTGSRAAAAKLQGRRADAIARAISDGVRNNPKALPVKAAPKMFGSGQGSAATGNTLQAPYAGPTGDIVRPGAVGRMIKNESGATSFKSAREAVEWAKSNLRDKSFTNNDTGWDDITITSSGIGKTINSNKQSLDSVRDIPKFIESAKHIDTQPYRGRDKNLAKAHYLEADTKLNGEPYKARLTVFEGKNGKKYYNHDLTKWTPAVMIGGAGVLGSDVPRPAGANSDSTGTAPNSQKLQRISDEQLLQMYNEQKQSQDYFDKLGMIESSNRYDARPIDPETGRKLSSAYGRYQFTSGTWRNVVKKYGEQYGVKVGDIKNPEAQDKMARALTRENYIGLMNHLGKEPDEGDLYIAHFAGLGGAKKLLNPSNSNRIAAKLMPAAAKANRNIYYDGKRPRYVNEVRAILKGKMQNV